MAESFHFASGDFARPPAAIAVCLGDMNTKIDAVSLEQSREKNPETLLQNLEERPGSHALERCGYSIYWTQFFALTYFAIDNLGSVYARV